IALDNLDAVIETIRSSADVDVARARLIENFDLSTEQANAILDMQLRRLAALERTKIEDEHKEITAHIAYLRDLLADKAKILSIIKEDLVELKERYGDERRTEVAWGMDADFNMEDLVRDEDVFISITRRGFVKRTPATVYRTQGRGGKGLIGMTTRGEDELEQLFTAGTHNSILFFSDRGKVYSIKAYEVPEMDRTAKGTSLLNILPLMPDEKITVALPVPDFGDAEYLTMITVKGRIKRVELEAFAKVRASGLIALTLDEDDRLGWVKMTDGDEDLILVSEQGKGIRFNEEDVRAMGRTAAGVQAMRLDTWDNIAGADVVTADDDLLIMTEKGYGKRTPLDDYRTQNRRGQGVRAMILDPDRTGKIIGARVVTAGDEVTFISTNGIILRTSSDFISQQGRLTQGVRIMDIREGDTVASMAVLREGRLSKVNENENGQANPADLDNSVEATLSE
ncbi:MAG: DNA gyrase C-terminal beta-propeller domain-containing protein, partial [Candidatus Promineifilaceae bacterium]|nr:DNA gyrase C-terminal beta-propeller domain-containing protein [Candidatus Promineifilaceae bacterium]